MTDVSKIQGPSGSPDRTNKEDSSVDPAKFQTIRKRVAEVSQTDPDEQKKRKQPEETGEEEALVQEEEITPPSQVPPFLLKQESTEPHLLETHAPSPALPDTTPLPSTPTAPAPAYTEGSFLYNTQESQPASDASKTAYSQPDSQATDIKNTTPASSKFSEEKKSSTPSSGIEKKAGEDTSAFFKQLKAHKLPSKEELSAAEIGPGVPAPLIDASKGVQEKKPSEEDGSPVLTEGGSVALPEETPVPISPPAKLSALNPYARLTPQVQELFDKMVGVMTVMNLSGIQETSFTLNSSQFASSVFFGAQIIIREFSTAPQVFNIQLNGSMQAINLFQAGSADLMAAFQAGNYNFKIHRLETGILDESPFLFKRKGAISDEKKDKGDPRK